MSFIAPAPSAPEEDLPHHPFWPAISPEDFRAVMNVDGTVTTARLIFALIESATRINRDLLIWRKEHEARGIAKLEDIPDEEPGRLLYLYRRAVYERAKADIMERYVGFSATGDEKKRAEQQDPAINDHYRNSLWAVRDMRGVGRTLVEMI
jgi:hypothetical protein